MKYIEILSCNDPHRWYSKHIGERFPLINIEIYDGKVVEYKTRASDGYINFILACDSCIIELYT